MYIGLGRDVWVSKEPNVLSNSCMKVREKREKDNHVWIFFQLNSITLFIDGYPVSLQPIFSGAINMSVDIIPLVKTYKKLCTNEII